MFRTHHGVHQTMPPRCPWLLGSQHHSRGCRLPSTSWFWWTHLNVNNMGSSQTRTTLPPLDQVRSHRTATQWVSTSRPTVCLRTLWATGSGHSIKADAETALLMLFKQQMQQLEETQLSQLLMRRQLRKASVLPKDTWLICSRAGVLMGPWLHMAFVYPTAPLQTWMSRFILIIFYSS